MTMRKMGSLEPVIYFINHLDRSHPEGFHVLAPYSSFPTPEGYERAAAETLADVDRLQRILIEQERREWEREAIVNEVLVAERRQAVRDRLYARMIGAGTSEYEREFIRLYLELREDKRERYRQRFMERTAFLWAREMDARRDRRVDAERVNLDCIG